MKSFLSFITEEADDTKLKHITHAEDRPLMHGAEGFNRAHGALMQAHEHTKSGGHSSHLTMKYDGSPSVVFGHHPENKKFFVASKSAFNANPKINYSHEDILKNHGHAPGLVNKLHTALQHLPKVTPKTGVYQGDMMFSHDDKTEHPDGGVSFTPNTISYKAKGDQAEKIKKAKMGMIVHTQYHGNDIKSMKSDPHPDVHNFGNHPDVWHKSANHDTKNVHYSEPDQAEFHKHMEAAKSIHTKHGAKMYPATSMHQGEGSHLATYINHTVKHDETPSESGLRSHIVDKYRKASEKLKTPAAIARKEAESHVHTDHIKANKSHYTNLLQMHHHLQQAKNVLVHNLDQHHGGLEHHIDGKPTNPEGYVVNHDGQPTKLVNRAEFSKANFAKFRK